MMSGALTSTPPRYQGTRLRSALLVAALLAGRRDLDHVTRSRIIAAAPTFDIRAETEIARGVKRACEAVLPAGHLSLRLSKTTMGKALRCVGEWAGRGVSIVPLESFRSGAVPSSPLLFTWGDDSLLDRASAAILNSRTSRQVSPQDQWIEGTISAFKEIRRRHDVMVSSFGTLSYCIVSRMASVERVSLILVCDGPLPHMLSMPMRDRFFRETEGLFPPSRTLMVSVFPPGRLPPGSERRRMRDEWVASLASELFAVHVREGGIMEAELEKAEKRGTPVVRRFSNGGIEGRRRAAGNSSRTCPHSRRRVIGLSPWPKPGSCLMHYTRSCSGPWPGQSMSRYCQSLIDGDPSAGHTALDTLMRILLERVIRGSTKLTRGATPVVSLTECLPDELEKLIEWRSGLIRWSFEPYGLAMDRGLLKKMGARRVVYGDESAFEGLAAEDRFRFQLVESGGKDWSVEKEWRIEEHLKLDELPPAAVTVIVPTVEEAARVIEATGHRVTLASPVRHPTRA